MPVHTGVTGTTCVPAFVLGKAVSILFTRISKTTKPMEQVDYAFSCQVFVIRTDRRQHFSLLKVDGKTPFFAQPSPDGNTYDMAS